MIEFHLVPDGALVTEAAPLGTEEKLGEEYLEPDRAFRLLFLSFKISQGSEDLQVDIFRWLHAQYPALRLSCETEQSLSSRAIPAFVTVVGNQRLHDPKPEEEVQSQIAMTVAKLKGALEYFSNHPTTALVPPITTEVLSRDYWYLQHGRPRVNPGTTAATDPFLSHVCHYGLLGNLTGSTEYDLLFGQIAEYLRSLVLVGPLSESSGAAHLLRNVVNLYNHHHPKQPPIDLATWVSHNTPGV